MDFILPGEAATRPALAAIEAEDQPEQSANPAKSKRKVLLIGWDAADWEHITRLLDERSNAHAGGFDHRGVMGNLATLQPVLSPMLWNSAATGKFADKHGIHGFIQPDQVTAGRGLTRARGAR